MKVTKKTAKENTKKEEPLALPKNFNQLTPGKKKKVLKKNYLRNLDVESLKQRIFNDFIKKEDTLKSKDPESAFDIEESRSSSDKSYESIRKKYYQEGLTNNIVNFINRLVSESSSLDESTRSSVAVHHQVFDVVQMMLMNEIEISYLSIYLERFSWNRKGFSFEENLLFTALISKLNLNTSNMYDIILGYLIRKIPRIKQRFDVWMKEVKDTNMFEVSPKILNQRFTLLSQSYNPYCRANYLDYNYMVDQILQMSLPYEGNKNDYAGYYFLKYGHGPANQPNINNLAIKKDENGGKNSDLTEPQNNLVLPKSNEIFSHGIHENREDSGPSLTKSFSFRNKQTENEIDKASTNILYSKKSSKQEVSDFVNLFEENMKNQNSKKTQSSFFENIDFFQNYLSQVNRNYGVRTRTSNPNTQKPSHFKQNLVSKQGAEIPTLDKKETTGVFDFDDIGMIKQSGGLRDFSRLNQNNRNNLNKAIKGNPITNSTNKSGNINSPRNSSTEGEMKSTFISPFDNQSGIILTRRASKEQLNLSQEINNFWSSKPISNSRDIQQSRGIGDFMLMKNQVAKKPNTSLSELNVTGNELLQKNRQLLKNAHIVGNNDTNNSFNIFGGGNTAFSFVEPRPSRNNSQNIASDFIFGGTGNNKSSNSIKTFDDGKNSIPILNLRKKRSREKL